MAITSLLCRIGWHDPLPNGRWNGGYCFTSCRRCGRDMVRSAFGEWHVPKGFRVVWAAEPPQDLAAALSARDEEPEHSVPLDQETVETPAAVIETPPAAPPKSAAPPAEPPASVQTVSASSRSPFDFDDFDDLDPAPRHRKRSKRRDRR